MLDPNATEFIPIVSVASGSNEVSEDPPRAVIPPARLSDQPQASTSAPPVVTSVSSTPTTSGTSSQAGHSNKTQSLQDQTCTEGEEAPETPIRFEVGVNILQIQGDIGWRLMPIFISRIII